jgi:hypothetical protein
MLEAVPGRIERGIREPVRAREIDEDGVGRSCERGSPLVLEAAEDELGAGRKRHLVRRERGQRSVQARVEHARRRAGERVGAQRDELELRMREHAIERLLAGIARGTDDRGRDTHSAYYA